MEKKEIELRFFIGTYKQSLINKINTQLSYELIKEVIEEDIYFTSKHKDFLDTEECLRIRDVDGVCEITWKPPTTRRMEASRCYWKREINLNLKIDQKDNAKALLKNLDFIECSTVKKKRIYYKIDNESLVTLDHITELGWFVEIETISNNTISSINKNRRIAESLNLKIDQAINIPYRDLVRNLSIQKRYLKNKIAYPSRTIATSKYSKSQNHLLEIER